MYGGNLYYLIEENLSKKVLIVSIFRKKIISLCIIIKNEQKKKTKKYDTHSFIDIGIKKQ